MWQGDSIQLAIDSGTASGKGGRVNTFYELGFALMPSGQVATFDWEGSFEWASASVEGEKTETGYRLKIAIPWANLALDPDHLPESIGINLVVNDTGPDGRRRYVEWTPGSAQVKDRSAFARAVFADPSALMVTSLKLDRGNYDSTQSINGQFVAYSLGSVPVSALHLTATATLDGARLSWPGIKLESMDSGTVQMIRFMIPPGAMGKDGIYKLQAETGEQDLPPGKVLASASFQRLDIEEKIISIRDDARKRMDDVTAQMKVNPQAAKDPYLHLGLAVVDRFLTKTDGVALSPEWRLLQAEEMQNILDEVQSRLKNQPKLISADERSKTPQPPVNPVPPASPNYLYGYLGYNSIVQDIPLFSGIGATLIGVERGPNQLNEDGGLTQDAKSATAILDSAAAQGLKVDFLLSPHYFPQWAMEKAPDIKLPKPAGAIRYNIDHPLAREVIQNWIKTFVPLVKDQPALLSLCLSNEPVYSDSGRDTYSKKTWAAYLEKKHGTVTALNHLYESQYSSFDEVPPPEIGMPDSLSAQRAYYDWIIFNQIHFAGWHQWMNDQVKALAPQVPTHAKIMTDIFDRETLAKGVDPELFCNITDWAGNDSYAWPKIFRQFAYDWAQEEMWYDLLHSFKGQPVFNSENHIILDATPAVHISPDHTRSVLWQSGLHHLQASEIWLWEEPSTHDAEGSICCRPGNMYAAGKTMLDLRRLGQEVTVAAQAPAQVALLYSPTSIFWQTDYTDAVKSAYTALSCLGQPLTFISERQLAQHARSSANEKVKWLILPRATHLSKDVVTALNRFIKEGGKIIALGKDCMKFDEYQQAQPAGALPTEFSTIEWTKGGDEDLAARLKTLLAQQGLKFDSLNEAHSDKPAWGVEYRVVRNGDTTLVPLINFLQHSQIVSLKLTGHAKDLLSGRDIDLNNITLLSLTPLLLQMKPDMASKP